MNLFEYMDRKVIIDDIKQFEGDFYELAIARKVIIEAAKIFYRNHTFFMDKENIKAREKLYNKEIDVRNIDDFSIVCNTYCRIIGEVLKENYDIDTELISPHKDKFRHVDLLLKTKKGSKYILDPLMDLERMQIGLKPDSFASKEEYDRFYVGKIDGVSFLTDEELRLIDDSIHYTINGMYIDDSLDMLREDFDNLETVLMENDFLAEELLGKKYEGEKLRYR